MAFAHLHVHSEYSLLDGCARLPQLVEKAKELEFEALAVTDHGGVYGLVPFYREATRQGLRPILGAELYMEPGPHGKSPYHLPVLARNEEGYRNLLRLATRGHLDGFHRKPMIRWEWLCEHGEGLIAFSGCLQGEIPQWILGGSLETAEQRTRDYMDIFGRDGFFLEAQRHGLPEEETVLEGLAELSRRTGCRLVATNDVHYLRKEDAKAHDLLLAVQTLSTIEQRDRLRLTRAEYELKNTDEMMTLFLDHPEALVAAGDIADACHVKLDFNRLRLPKFPIPGGETAADYLMRQAMEGLARRGLDGEVPLRRLRYELEVIIRMGLAEYFLIVADITAFARREGIPVGPGRGSGVGSLTAFVLGITEVNPLEYGLLFERFLNPERQGMPDIDIDLCHRGRPRVLEYVRRKYGRDHVAHLGAFVTLRPRAVVRDAGRALGVAYDTIDHAAKLIPFHASTIDRALAESPRLMELAENPELGTVLEYGRALEGLPRHMTQHAAGVVITQEPLTDVLALQKAGGEEVITQADMGVVAAMGLLKMDLLGLRFLTVIDDALESLKRDGIILRESEIPLDDSAVYEAMSRGDTVGTFQLESGGMRRLLRQYRPEHLHDIVAILALFRPGPINSGMVETYIRRRHGLEPTTYPHPLLEPVLSETYGVILYQEQVMEVARVLAGYTLGQADLLRRAVSKRDPQALRRERSTFVERSKGRGVSVETAEAIFDLIQEFGYYGFAKAHSAAYALTAYRTVYLKIHYPVAYHAALLSLNWGVPERFGRYLAETRRKGIAVLLPDINRSEALFQPEGTNIRAGLVMVRDLGEKGLRHLLTAREQGGEMVGLADLLDRTRRQSLTRRAVENLIRCGSCSGWGMSRPQLLFELRQLWTRTRRSHPDQRPLFAAEILREVETPFQLEEYPERVCGELEKELLGHYLTQHPLEMVEDDLKGIPMDRVEELKETEKPRALLCGLVDGVRSHRTRRGERMLFAVLEDLTGIADLVIFPKVLGKYGHLLMEKTPLLVWGQTDMGDNGLSLVVEGMRRVREK